ncbi:Histidine biosynthesis bifunctional protein HisB [uncultured archaeon]|nr:Histidine biosynthesis bifunctional protein HisB [uncultured archaeon]
MIKAVFLDRDGTIVNEPTGPNKGDDAITSISQLKVLPHAIDGMKKMIELGYTLFIASNQDCINRGQITMKEYDQQNKVLITVFTENNIKIEKWLVCPHTPEENCECRKPKTEMIDSIKNDYQIDFENSYYIGDRETDILLAKNLKLKSILVKRNEEYYINTNIVPDFKAENLVEASKFIKSLKGN